MYSNLKLYGICMCSLDYYEMQIPENFVWLFHLLTLGNYGGNALRSAQGVMNKCIVRYNEQGKE
jgi:hypothetical protein